MIIKCTNCSSALVYDVALGKMKCQYCDSAFDVKEVEVTASEEEMMECNVFVCSECAAQLVVNSSECATYCAYCGQPTIVFKHTSKMRKPEKIIPFTITKEEAIEAIRKQMHEGFFIPKSIKKFEVERMNGIYVPFWLFDVKYHDRQHLTGKRGRNNSTRHFYRDETANFKKLTIDASSNFCNESAQRLEPFETEKLIKFEEPYLSGFYADCYDQSDKDLNDRVFERCKKIFDEESQKRILANAVRIESSYPEWEILDKCYALLPVWFMTIRYEEKPYTMLVNGQTGKVVGAVPINKKKVVGVFIALLAFFMSFVPRFCSNAFDSILTSGENVYTDTITWLIMWGFITFWVYAFGIINQPELNKHIRQASDKKLTDFTEKRQEKNG